MTSEQRIAESGKRLDVLASALRRRDALLRDLIKALEDVHDSHKRHGLPLTDAQFAKLNRARSELGDSHDR